MATKFTHKIDLPNGQGYMPCTAEYRAAYDTLKEHENALKAVRKVLNQDNTWMTLKTALDNLQLGGIHLGPSVRLKAM